MTSNVFRLIETEKEIDLLPEGSVVRNRDDWITYVHCGRRAATHDGSTYTEWRSNEEGSGRPDGPVAPAWVLWEGLVPREPTIAEAKHAEG